jgi:hypothetical protein
MEQKSQSSLWHLCFWGKFKAKNKGAKEAIDTFVLH